MIGVKRAIIPAAGLGTRMRPVSLVIPKELLPVGTRPMIQFAVEEAIEAQISEIAIVLNKRKELIRAYFEQLAEQEPFAGVRFYYYYQEEANGLADAIDHCRDLVEGSPFAVLLPDNVILSENYRFSSMVGLYAQHGRDVIGVIELGQNESGLYGNAGRIDYEMKDSDVLEIHKLYDKEMGALIVSQRKKVLRTCGRYVCHSDLFQYMDKVRPHISGEFDEVPVYQEIIRQRGAMGYLIREALFDTGNPRGYLSASAHLAAHLKEGSSVSSVGKGGGQ